MTADPHCPDCECGHEFSRRDFVKTAGAAAAAAGVSPLIGSAAAAAPTATSAAETTVKRLFGTLTDTQKKTIHFPFGHKLQHKLSANWSITKPKIGSDFYTGEQRKLIDEIVKGVTSEDGYKILKRQMKDDWGGFGRYKIALFGEPGSGKFQWELTGRHLTLRCDGDSVENMAFGGPISYGHGVSNPKKNLFHYQTKKSNEVFRALDVKQQAIALLERAPKESAVPIQGKAGTFPGISVGDLSDDQKKLVAETVRVVLSPYRKEDVDEVMAILKTGGGIDKLSMAFYKKDAKGRNVDLLRDLEWDVWRVEGPTFVSHFRGAPHVHAYINIGTKKA
ncbi:MAG: DUF3500 domain-containing protein [Planctomycetaceae bacterium]